MSFDHDHTREIFRKLDDIIVRQETIRHDQLHLRGLIENIMADLQTVKDAQAAETQSIVDLAARVAALPTGAATASDLDGIVSTAQANKAAIDAIAPTPTV